MVLSDGDSVLKIRPAKTKKQQHRNWAVNKAIELIKADPKSANAQQEVNWQVGGKRSHQQIKVNGQVVFEQCPSDYAGNFLGAFQHLFLP